MSILISIVKDFIALSLMSLLLHALYNKSIITVLDSIYECHKVAGQGSIKSLSQKYRHDVFI